MYFEAENIKYENDENVNGVFKYNILSSQMERIRKDVGVYHIDNENMIFTKDGESNVLML